MPGRDGAGHLRRIQNVTTHTDTVVIRLKRMIHADTRERELTRFLRSPNAAVIIDHHYNTTMARLHSQIILGKTWGKAAQLDGKLNRMDLDKRLHKALLSETR
jgi:hypothetical protein